LPKCLALLIWWAFLSMYLRQEEQKSFQSSPMVQQEEREHFLNNSLFSPTFPSKQRNGSVLYATQAIDAYNLL
jgi:hypothetical protein